MSELKRYKVWDRTTRIFHWVNATTVILLMLVGTIILNAKILGITGEAKVLLKTIHAYIGYVFVINLIWRLIWAFFGNHFSRWKQILPFGKNYRADLKEYSASIRSDKPQQYLGHNPIAKLIIGLFFLLLTIQASTGLIIAGTDLYLPPFGDHFAEWVTEGDSERLDALKPGDKTHVIEAAYKEMRDFRKPIITIHYYLFFVLLALVLVHIIGVIYSEIKEKSGLISAMITGIKTIEGEPEDK
ncbi:MAG: cytochrome b/b6 domain-containing protein [Gammaproteobacteria bacterium]